MNKQHVIVEFNFSGNIYFCSRREDNKYIVNKLLRRPHGFGYIDNGDLVDEFDNHRMTVLFQSDIMDEIMLEIL